MSRWGLRWILWWLGVIVTACTQLVSPTPPPKAETPTPLPSMLSPTLDNPSRTASTPDIRPITLEPIPALSVLPPACYEQPNGTLICLGWVVSYSNLPADQIIVTAQLLSQQGVLLDEVRVSPDIDLVLPQQRIPYRAIFDNVPELGWSTGAVIEWHPLSAHQRDRVTVLMSNDIEVTWRGRDYAISGSFTNASDDLVRLIQVITTIENQQRLSGLRVYSFEVELEPNASLPFEVALAPLDGEEGIVDVVGYGTLH